MARSVDLAAPPGPPRGDSRLAKHAKVGSPVWQLHRLHLALQLRRGPFAKLQRYFDGEFDLKYTDQKLRQVFGNVFYADRFGVNWSRLVVETVEEKLQVEGIRVGDAKTADRTAWDLWQANDLDESSSGAHLEALLNGASYVTVWPGDDPRWPEISVSHPTQAIVEVDPRRPRRRVAGLRIYSDSWGYLHAELFMPDTVYLFRSSASFSGSYDPDQLMWLPDDTLSPDGEMANPWGVVPMVEFANVPRLLTWQWESIARRSELWTVMPVQDLVNQTLFNMALIANSQGYRQRWVTGLDLEVDEKTGQPKEPFKGGIDRLLSAEDKDTKFGEFEPADVTGLIKALDMLVNNIASISKVPPHYLSASADRLSGESIKASESGLVAKVKRKQTAFGNSWETVMRLAGLMTDNAALAQDRGSEIMWANAETRSEAGIGDAALKMAQIGVPWRAIMEYLGFSPQQIVRMEVERATDALTQQLQAVVAPMGAATGLPSITGLPPGPPPPPGPMPPMPMPPPAPGK